MSAHSSPPSEHSGSSIWSLLNVIIAAAIGGFTFLFAGVLFIGSIKQSAGLMEAPPAAATAATAAAAAATAAASAPAAPASPAPASPAPASPAPAAVPAAPAPVAAAATAAPAAAASGVAEITIKPDVANPLAYDTKEFKVKAGQKVKLIFNNTHPAVPQPHNIVIAKPGTKDKLLALAMAMAAAPDGMAKGFIPESPDILFHTKLLQPNTSETLEFTAPAAGEYPYLCTFPGHGIIMNGVMKVD
jgi:azurin